jgi:primosomal protein N' (replication factor Y)
MDLDTTRTRNAYERLISDFSQGKTNLLIGTQMISKGLDFDRVSVVGILNADSMLNYPDFRAYEHAFMMMAQVSGRAGRKGKRGLVMLQTKSPELPVVAGCSRWCAMITRDFIMISSRSARLFIIRRSIIWCMCS